MPNIKFVSPDSPSVDLLVISGEASGDEHASLLVNDLLKEFPTLKISALGGKCLKNAGADLIYPLVDHAVVGLFEVLKNYFLFKSLFVETINWIKKYKPKTILLVDYPGFNLRIARELKKSGISLKGGGHIKVLQYISPQLWAWKPKRRFMMEEVLSGLAVLFNFELGCYKDTKLPVSFVGHPFGSPDYQSKIHFDPNGSLLILPGSRVQAVERILPVFLDAFHEILEDYPNLNGVIPVPDKKIFNLVEKIVYEHSNLRNKIQITEGLGGFKARAALMSSGTMSFECAVAGVPGVIAYKSHPFTYFIGRKLVKVAHLGMANILLPNSPPYPEFLQGLASANNLKSAVVEILKDESINLQFQSVSKKLLELLRPPKDGALVKWLVKELQLL
jgi:lipid-A-disaccharide synthase